MAEGVRLDVEAEQAVAEILPAGVDDPAARSETRRPLRLRGSRVPGARSPGRGRRQNEEKSCSPMSGSQARRSAARSRGSATCHVVRPQERVGHRPVQHRVVVARGRGPRSGRRSRRRPPPPSRTTRAGPHSLLSARRRASASKRSACDVEAHDLAPGVHAPSVRPAPVTTTGCRSDQLDGLLERAGDRAQARLGGEAEEGRAVVGDGHADAHERPRGARSEARRGSSKRESVSLTPGIGPDAVGPDRAQTSSMRAIGALSPSRGPSLRMRV